MNQTAQGLAALGRGPDTQLVHMAPGEVKSLQQLAMAHGGSLTINPETGLPEAGFLSSILPMVLGAGAMMIPGLQGFGAAGIGLGIGGLEALRTGSLKKGLMAGFGAYGGAGLAGGLTAAGAASGAGAAGAGTPEILGGLGAQPATFSGNLAQAGQGLTALPTSEAARTAFMGNAALKGSGVGGAKGLMQYGLAAAAPMMMETTTKQPEIKTDKDMGQRYRFNAGTQTPTPTPDVPGYENQGINFGKEQRYFNPTYTPIDNDAAKKLYGFASGGPVEAMSNANAIGMNTGYPQSGIRTGAYATPDQQPISRDMLPYPGQPQFAGGGSINLQGTFDMGGGQGGGASSPAQQTQPFVGSNNAPSMTQPAVMPQNHLFRGTPEPAVMPRGLQGLLKGPMSQGMAFAEGGEVGGYTYDPVTQMYVKKGGEGATMVSPTGGISGASAGVGGTENQPLSPQTLAFLDAEAAKPGARDARMQGINDLLTSVSAVLSPGSTIARAVLDTPFAGGIANFFDPPGAVNYGIPVEDAVGRSVSEINNPAGSSDTGPRQGDTPADGGGGDFSDTSNMAAKGGLMALAQGGISHLGDYSDGGRLLRGPGDGISDSIPAMIGKKQPARLADGEFVVPARIVSELGNGSTEAGARKLYAMMDRVQKARKKTVGKGKVAANSRSAKYLPA